MRSITAYHDHPASLVAACVVQAVHVDEHEDGDEECDPAEHKAPVDFGVNRARDAERKRRDDAENRREFDPELNVSSYRKAAFGSWHIPLRPNSVSSARLISKPVVPWCRNGGSRMARRVDKHALVEWKRDAAVKTRCNNNIYAYSSYL